MGEIKDAADKADKAAQEVANSRWFERAARAGFVANGIVHLILGVTAFRLALGHGGSADQGGAIGQMATQPLGAFLLWFCFLGCALLALWNLIDAFFGSNTLRGHGSNDPRQREGRSNWKGFLKTVGQGVAYLVVAVTFAQFLFSGGKDSSQASASMSSKIAQWPGGVFLLVLGGLVAMAVGVVFVVNGLRRSWKDELRTPSSPALARTLTTVGVVGYVAKGLTVVAVGLLFVVSALQNDPGEAGGVDAALKAVREQPFGPYLLGFMGLGLALYGVFLFLRSRYDRMD